MTTVGIYRHGKKLYDGEVYVGRSSRRPHLCEVGKWGYFGNPFRLPDKPTASDLRDCIRLYLDDLEKRMADPSFAAAVDGLKGKRLLCYCIEWDGDLDTLLDDGVKCHGQVLGLVADGHSFAAIRDTIRVIPAAENGK